MKVPGAMTAEATALLNRDADMSTAEFLDACEAFLAKWKTMPKPLSDRRRARLRALRIAAQGEGRMVRWVAQHLGFEPNRFSKLTSASEEVAA